jgi:peptidoglycan-associated lipoprotein
VATPPPAPAPTITFTASQTAITTGQSTTLEWTATNANAVSIDPGIGPVATNGTRSVSPTASVTYNATATGPGGTASAPVRITVNPVAAAAPAPAPAAPVLTVDQLFARDMQSILFDYDRSEIRPSEVAKVQTAVGFLQANAALQITISGHADERGSQEYNIGLGDRRANAVRQALIERGIALTRINTVSFGEERPVCTVANENCWQQNRRAEFARR